MFIISFLGQYLGYIIAYFTQDELKQGNIYFRLIEIVCLSYLFFFNHDLILWLFLIGFMLGFLFNSEYFFFPVFSNFISLFILFIYGLAYGTLNFKKLNKLNCNVLLIIPLFILSIKFNLISLGLGGVLGSIIHKFKSFF